MAFEMALDASDFLKRTGDLLQRQLPQIEVWALNWTADDALDALKDRMQVQFDRPTRWTLGAFQVWRATKADRTAKVQEKPSVGRRHYLKVQNQGGGRPQTGIEKLIDQHVVSAQILRTAIPATGGPFEGARLDAYGNWSRGERNQVLSQLQAQRDDAANTTQRSARRARNRARYFVPKHGLAPGVYRRNAPDDIPVRVLKFSDKVPTYTPVLQFEGTVAAIYRDRLGVNLRRAFDRALATSR
ncbi:hypothetical protein JI664_23580 [Rhodobacter sp. NTK016B]|uniref:hypothetical protein n=1 Tax=Rhodobacter sp. NTK016B TaxID=2759676 RepID=UPI001A8D956B|nr:hypothetical protein [Rhodobacter sp. NTK016B]MBN8294968.1 hypothetical protein [Rhodobacter sp. NTK016B]